MNLIHKNSIYSILIGLQLLILNGCTTTQSTSINKTKSVKINTMNFDQITAHIHQNKGKPMLINFWATWCEPCVDEIPDLIKLHKKFNRKGLLITGFSVDFPDEIDTKVKPFIRKYKLPYPIYVIDVDDQDIVINYFSKEWFGAVPATFLFDSNGNIVNKKIGKMNYSELNNFIEPIFKELQ